MKPYETTLILDPQLQEEGWEKAIEKYAAIITRKGTIKRTDRWGLRRLAYEIKRCSQGYYVHFIHESSPDVPRDIERQCELDETCLRYLTVVADNPKFQEEMIRRQVAREGASVAAGPGPAGRSAVADTGDDEGLPLPDEDIEIIEDDVDSDEEKEPRE